MKKSIKLLSILLVLAMVAALLPVEVFAEGTKKLATTISTVPQYVKSGTTALSNASSGASTARTLPYGTAVYYLLRTKSGSAGNIEAPDYVDPDDYSISIDGGVGVAANGISIVSEVCTSGATYWYLRVQLISHTSGSTAVKGSITITPTGKSDITLSLDYNKITLSDGDTAIYSMGTQAQEKGDDGVISTLNAEKCYLLEYGDVIYYPLRSTSSSSSYITGADDITANKYTCTYEKTASEEINAIASAELVYDKNKIDASRWWIKITLKDKAATDPDRIALKGTFRIRATDPATNVSMSPEDGNYKLAIGGRPAEKRIVAATSTAPQYIADGETYIAQNQTSAGGPTYFPFDKDVYFLLRYANNSSSNIVDPDYIVPADYTVACDSDELAADSWTLEKHQYADGTRWYLHIKLRSRVDEEDNVPVEGTVTITHDPNGAVTTLSLTDRHMIMTTDTSPRPFTRIATWAQRRTNGTVSSISGANNDSPTIDYGEKVYYALAKGSSTSLTDPSLFDPGDYTVTYTPTAENNFDPFDPDGLSLVYTDYSTSSESGRKWFLELQTIDDPQGLKLVDGLVEITLTDTGSVVASLDLAANVPIIMGGEDDTVNRKGVKTVTLVHSIDTVKMVEDENGLVGRASTDLGGISSNVGFGESAYYLLLGTDKLGGEHMITDPDAVKDIKIHNKLEDNADKVDKIEIVKKRSVARGVSGYYYFLALRIVEKTNWTSRYTINGKIELECKGKYGITTADNKCSISIDTTVGPDYAHSTNDITDSEERHRLNDTHRRFSFGDDELGSDKEDELFLFGMNDDNYFTVDTRGQDDILLGNNVDYYEPVGDLYPDADLFFFNGTKKEFNHHGVLTFSAAPDSFIYERNGNVLSKVYGLRYDDSEMAFKIYTKKIGSYVFSDKELDYDRYNVDHIGTWAQTPNEDGSLSSISGASDKGPFVEYGSTVYYALRDRDDKGITNQLALDPEHFTFGFASNDKNSPVIKEAGIVYRTNLIKSTDSRSDKFYVAITFAEVPDPGVARTVSGDFIIYYKGDEITRMPLGPTDKGDFTLTVFGGRPVADDWVPFDYVVPELKTADASEQKVINYLEAENEGGDGDGAVPAENGADTATAD